MALIITPDSDLGKEYEKWNKPYTYQAFPKMVYRAAQLPNGKDVCGADEWEVPGPPGQPPQVLKIKTTMTVTDERELARALESGWKRTPGEALKAVEERANQAAVLAHDNRRMSPEAKAEYDAANAEMGLDHALDVPRKPGRPKKARPESEVG